MRGANMRAIHLSDVHYHPSQKAFSKKILNPLIVDLKRMNSEKKIDLIFFTGDLIDKGGVSRLKTIDTAEAFSDFEKNFIQPIVSSINLPKEYFIFIPGNHDIDRKKIKQIFEEGLRNTLKTSKAISQVIHNKDELHLERIENYQAFEQSFYKESSNYTSYDLGYSYNFSNESETIGIAGINSSWRCYDENDKGHLIVSEKQLDDIDSGLNEDYDLKIALIHHPFQFLVKEDAEEIEKCIIRDYDLLLMGHDHSTMAENTEKSYGGSLIISQASSNWSMNVNQDSKKYSNGYTIIDFSKVESNIELIFRKYNDSKNCFVANTDLGQGDSAKSLFYIDKKKNKDWINFFTSIQEKLEDFTNEVNKIMVSYGTDSGASSDFDDIFVSPRFTLQKDSTDTHKKLFQDTKALDFNNIVNFDKSLIFLGPKEIGKTTVLYKLYQSYYESSLKDKIIPAYIDILNLKKESIKKNLGYFLGLSNNKLEHALSNYNIVLLLDNLKIDSTILSKKRINEITDLLSKYNKLKIHITSTSYGEQSQPLKVYGSELSKYFEIVNIRYFGSKEIKNLMKNWLGENCPNENSLDDLVKSFHDLSIPSTPLSVSLFLWIYEKQRNFRPVNTAKLVQNFVEKLFEKHSKDDIYSDGFDYTNKENILSIVSYKMLHEDDKNYRLEKAVLEKTINDSISRKKMTVPQVSGYKEFTGWLISYFEEKGIFLSEIENETKYYHFKLKCFLDYFLSRYMELNPSFKEEVLNENNYVCYEEEIDYYTGLNRHKSDVLNFVYENMLTTFRNLIIDTDDNLSMKSIIKNSKVNFSTYFNVNDSRKSIIDLIDLSNTDEKSIDKLLNNNKKSEKDKEKENDNLLSNSNFSYQKGELVKKESIENISPLDRLQRSWIITAKVLKNVDELDDGDFKFEVFRGIAFCSLLCLLVLHKQSEKILTEGADTETDKEIMEFASFFIRFGIVLHGNILYSSMGTNKLNDIVEEYLDPFISDYQTNKPRKKNDEITPVEQLFIIFYYVDNKGKNLQKYLNYAISEFNGAFLTDAILMKLSVMHAEAINNSSYEKMYKQLINKLIKQKEEGKSIFQKNNSMNDVQNKLNKTNFTKNIL